MLYGRRELRSAQHLRRRRTLLYVKGSALLILIAACVGGVSALTRLDGVTIKDVAFSGNDTISGEVLTTLVKEQLQGNYGFLFSRANSFLYPRNAIEASVYEAFPRVKAVKVARDSLHVIAVSIQERAPVGIWCTKGEGEEGEVQSPDAESIVITSCFFLDDEGFIFASASKNDEGVRYEGSVVGPPIGSELLPPSEFKPLSLFVRELEKLDFTPTRVALLAEGDANIAFSEGFELLISRKKDYTQTFENLRTVLDEDALKNNLARLSYIDLRFGNKVFYKFK